MTAMTAYGAKLSPDHAHADPGRHFQILHPCVYTLSIESARRCHIMQHHTVLMETVASSYATCCEVLDAGLHQRCKRRKSKPADGNSGGLLYERSWCAPSPAGKWPLGSTPASRAAAAATSAREIDLELDRLVDASGFASGVSCHRSDRL